MIDTALHRHALPVPTSSWSTISPACAPRCVRALEERTLTAWPSLEEIGHEGWLLRFGEGFIRRSNCVLPLGGCEHELRERVDVCEREYGRRRLPAVFKMLPGVTPERLEPELGRRGYASRAATLALVRELGDDDEPGGSLTLVDAHTWLEVYARCCGITAREQGVLQAMLRRIVPIHAFAVLGPLEAPISCGVAVCHAGYVGLFCVGTQVQARNRGHGRQLLRGMLHWAHGQGARKAFLQVPCGNAPAVHLYQHLGFRPVYRFHYRIQPV